MELAGKTVLVVGGSGVLGAALVRELTTRGAKVLATCSSNESAARIPSQAQLSLLADLNSSESIQVLTDYLNSTQPIDGIVIASGRVGFGTAQQTTQQEVSALTQVNFLGPAMLIRNLLPNLTSRSESFVAAITGIVAEKTFPGMSAYSASKSAFSSWLSTLSLETKRHGIRVLDARPGHTETGLASRPLFGSAPNMPTGMTAEHVVQKIGDAIESELQILDSSAF